MELKLDLSKLTVKSVISDEQIYRRYLPSNFDFNYCFSSPFRKDTKPSFIIGGPKHNYRWKDFATGESDDAIGFVMKLFSLNFLDALERIVIDLGYASKFNLFSNVTTKPSTKIAPYENVMLFDYGFEGPRTVSIVPRDWNEFDIAYWESMGVSQKLATQGWITPISCYYVNGRYTQCGSLTFAFAENKDGEWTYKIYQPKNPYKKWINYNDLSVIELWHLLPSKGKFLIITSSRKDALAVIDNVKIPSIAFQAESINPKKNVMNQLEDRFDYIFLLYDNDFDSEENWGQRHANRLLKDYPNLINIKIPKEYNAKDFSDLVFKHGKEQAIIVLKKILREAFDAFIESKTTF